MDTARGQEYGRRFSHVPNVGSMGMRGTGGPQSPEFYRLVPPPTYPRFPGDASRAPRTTPLRQGGAPAQVWDRGRALHITSEAPPIVSRSLPGLRWQRRILSNDPRHSI